MYLLSEEKSCIHFLNHQKKIIADFKINKDETEIFLNIHTLRLVKQ